MQICKEHWQKLRQAITDRGLEHLVAKSGEAAAESMVRELKGEADKTDFDPLMGANWAICGQFLNNVGLAAMIGDLCPLCEVNKQRDGLADNWINGSSEDQLQQARAAGLVPQPA